MSVAGMFLTESLLCDLKVSGSKGFETKTIMNDGAQRVFSFIKALKHAYMLTALLRGIRKAVFTRYSIDARLGQKTKAPASPTGI
jgi:hypothetical protein